MTDTTPTPEAVERFSIMWGDLGQEDDGDWVRASDYDALQARYDKALRDLSTKPDDALLARVDALTKERDTTLAASGAVAEAMREAVWAKIEESMSITTREDEALAADMRDEIRALPIPPVAAAALAEHDKRVREEERAEIVAMITEKQSGPFDDWDRGKNDACEDIAAAILARGESI